MKILVCLPTYNEEVNIESMIDRLEAINLEMLVVDGQSTDKTVEIAISKGVRVINRDGFGKGSAIIKCLEYAENHHFDKIVTIDCDQTYHPEDIPQLIAHAPKYDMVVGARPMQNITFWRRLANYFMNFITNVLYHSKVKDMATGLRLIDVKKFKSFLNAKSFDIEPQIYAVALREKFKVKEIEVSYDKRIGESKINILHLFAIIYRLVVERFK